jgi:hypothetical protein
MREGIEVGIASIEVINPLNDIVEIELVNANVPTVSFFKSSD